MKPNSLPSRLFQKYIELEKRHNRKKPAMPFVGEKKQMWYFLMNQVDQSPPEQGVEGEESAGK